jgi:hypothetical protein
MQRSFLFGIIKAEINPIDAKLKNNQYRTILMKRKQLKYQKFWVIE